MGSVDPTSPHHIDPQPGAMGRPQPALHGQPRAGVVGRKWPASGSRRESSNRRLSAGPRNNETVCQRRLRRDQHSTPRSIGRLGCARSAPAGRQPGISLPGQTPAPLATATSGPPTDRHPSRFGHGAVGGLAAWAIPAVLAPQATHRSCLHGRLSAASRHEGGTPHGLPRLRRQVASPTSVRRACAGGAGGAARRCRPPQH